MKKLLTFLTLLTLSIGVSWAAVRWVETNPADLVTGDIVVIANGATKHAMCNDNGASSAPSVKEYTLNEDLEISSEVTANMQWVVTNNSGTYKFQVSGTNNYLYCTNSNNGVRVGTNTNNTFKVTKDNTNHPSYQQLKHDGTSRYVGEYNNQDWRCYTSAAAGNIVSCTTLFYKKVEDGSSQTTVATPIITLNPASGPYYVGDNVTASIACDTEGATLTYSLDNGSTWQAYSSAVTIPSTTAGEVTITAKAAANGEEATATKTVTFIASLTSLADVNALADGSSFMYDAQTVVLGAKGKQMYIVMPNNTAGALVYDAANDWGDGYTFGQVIKGGWSGSKTTYNDKPEVTSPTNFSLAGTELEVTPTEITASDLTKANFGRYAVLKNQAVNATGSIDGITIYNQFDVTPDAAGVYDVYGVIGWNKGKNDSEGEGQFMPLEYRAVTVTGSDYYLAGTFNDWNAQDVKYKFTNLGNGTYTLTDINLPDDVQFKIVENGTTWYGGLTNDENQNNCFAINSGLHNGISLTNSYGNNYVKNFKMQVGGISNITINTSTMKFDIEKETPQFYIKCSDDWTNKISMNATNDGGWTITKELAANTQFGFDDEWTWYGGNNFWIYETNLGTELTLDSNNPFQMVDAGKYIITVNSAKTKVIVTKFEEPTGDVYTLVENEDDLEAGAEYIISGGASGSPYSLLMGAVSNNLGTVVESGFTYNESAKIMTLTDDCTAQVLTLGGTSGAWTFYTGSAYLSLTNASNNLYTSATAENDNAKWTIDVNEMPASKKLIANNGYTTTRYLEYNSGNPRFACYTGSQQAVALFKKATPSNKSMAPVITPASGDIKGGKVSVTITAAEGATIYCTTDGNDPTTSITPYSEAFEMTGEAGTTKTVKAIAVESGKEPSAVATATYKFVAPAKPTFSPASGTSSSSAINVTIESADGGTIYYVINPETAPTAGSAVVSADNEYSSISLTEVGTYNIYAAVSLNGITSSVANATYTITSGGGETPVGDGDYVKVTKTADLTDGEYLIVYEVEGDNGVTAGLAFDGSLETLDAVGNNIEVVISDYTIASSTEVDAATFTIDVTAGTIKSASGKYIYMDANNNGLKQSTTVPEQANAISIDEEKGNAVIVSSSAYLRYNSASNQDRFRYYKSSSYTGQEPIALYKKVVEEPATDITLAGLVELGAAADGKKYCISDENGLLGVYKSGNTVWFKDEVEKTINLTNETLTVIGGAVDFNTPGDEQNYWIENIRTKDFDQSNWIEVDFTNVETPEAVTGQEPNVYIKNLTGTYSYNGGKRKLVLTKTPDEVTAITNPNDAYVPNPYIPANFYGTQQGYFFSKPKVQEYAKVVDAQWNGTKMVMGDNNAEFVGSFTIEPVEGLTVGNYYTFHGIISRSIAGGQSYSTPRLQAEGDYDMITTDLAGQEGSAVTAISTVGVNGEVKSVKYVSVAGVVSDRPFQGVNIVVTEYTDGSRTTAKVVK